LLHDGPAPNATIGATIGATTAPSSASPAVMIALACSVRGCGRPLAAGERSLVCPSGHAFDRARSGYVNLLQPQDRRSLDAGDARAVVDARRRLHAAGLYAPLAAELERVLAELDLRRGARVLDVGCGSGDLLAGLARRFALDAAGLDLSVHAIDLAARAHPEVAWIVANGDRRLPIVDGGLDLVLSVTARRAPAEFARVLGPRGHAVVVVPGAGDLAELRELVLGAAAARARTSSAISV
jgi:23S rRNA (guanine745-N1)-methyltransferase